MDRRSALKAVAVVVLAPLTMAQSCRGGGPLQQSELPTYSWEELDIAYPPDQWAHELTGAGERPSLVGGKGWQRAGFLKGTYGQTVIWVRRW